MIPYKYSQFLCQLDKQFLKKRGGRGAGERGKAENVVCEAQVCGQKSGLVLGLLMLPVLCFHFISERFIK